TDHVLREAIDQKLRRRIFVGFEDPRVSFEMFEHAVLIAALQQERLHRDGRQVGYNDPEFLWDALGVRDVGHDEAGHARQQRDRLRNVAPGRNLKLEQDPKVVPLAQFLPYRIEHSLTLIREATEDQHHLGSYGVDHVADFLVIKHEVDELRDLDVVDGDRGLVLTCDDQVLLLGLLQFQTPCGYAVDATTGEVST